GGKMPRPALTALVVISDEMEEHAFDKVAKPATLRIGAAERTAQQPQGELLKQFLNGFGIAHRAQQVTANGAAVTLDQACLGGLNFPRRAMVGFPPNGPERLDLAQVLSHALVAHELAPQQRRLRTNELRLILAERKESGESCHTFRQRRTRR